VRNPKSPIEPPQGEKRRRKKEREDEERGSGGLMADQSY
jgi:hypothetical protein